MKRGQGCDGCIDARDERGWCMRQNRVVLIPRRWDQVREDHRERRWLESPAHRGERGISLKPSRRECRIVSAYLWFLTRVLSTSHTRLRVRSSTGTPCALRFSRDEV